MRPAILIAGLVGVAAVAGAIGLGFEHAARQTEPNAGAQTPQPNPAPPVSTPPFVAPLAVPGEPASAEARAAGATALLAPPSGAAMDRLSSPADGQQAADPAVAQAPANAFSALRPVDLANPLAERAGVLVFGNRMLQLGGIAPTDPNRICTGPSGKAWPCGTVARTALRSFLRGRDVTCDLPGEAWQGMLTTQCRYVRVDLSRWLVQNGWAEAASGSALAPTAEEARKAGRGIYGDGPKKEGPSTLAPLPKLESPLNPI